MNEDRSEREPERAPERRDPVEAGRRQYQTPRIVKKRAVSRATLFSGSGPDTGGMVTA